MIGEVDVNVVGYITSEKGSRDSSALEGLSYFGVEQIEHRHCECK